MSKGRAKKPKSIELVKVAIKIPSTDFFKIEELRAEMDLTRSAFFLLVIRAWMKDEYTPKPLTLQKTQDRNDSNPEWPQDDWERGLMDVARPCGVSLPISTQNSEYSYD